MTDNPQRELRRIIRAARITVPPAGTKEFDNLLDIVYGQCLDVLPRRVCRRILLESVKNDLPRKRKKGQSRSLLRGPAPDVVRQESANQRELVRKRGAYHAKP